MKQFLNILTTGGSLIVLLITVGLIMQFRPREMSQTTANITEGSHASLLSAPIIQDEVTATDAPTPTSQDTMSLGTVEQPLQQLVEIENVLLELSQKNRDWLSTPGWLHIVTAGYSLPTAHGKYQGTDMQDMFAPDGQGEEWAHIIDDQGNIAEGLSVSRTGDGRELQRSVTRPDGTSGNLTLLRKGLIDLAIISKEEKNNQPIQTTSTVDEDALDDLQRWGDTATTISGWQEIVDRNQMFVFYLELGDKAPMQVEALQEPVVGSSEKYVFDLETGHPISIEYQLLTEKGEWVLLSRAEFLVIEIVPELPDSVAIEYQQAVEELNSFLESGQ